MDLFPYSPRANQKEFVNLVENTIRTRSHLVLESGTGTGKTVCALTGALQQALKDGKRVLYLTRTNSQQRQVMTELRRINEHEKVFGMGIQGRNSTCPLIHLDPELLGGNPEELSRLCSERKRNTIAERPNGCEFYARTREAEMAPIQAFCTNELPTVEEFVDHCDSKGLCPYELMKELLPDAVVVTAPYTYFFHTFVRNPFLDWMNVSLEDLVVILDEAHNLPDYLREVKTMSLSVKTLTLLDSELGDYGDPEIMNGVSAMDLHDVLIDLLEEAQEEYLLDEDGLIPPSFLEEGLMVNFRTTSQSLENGFQALRTHGEIVREEKKQTGRLPRSYMHTLGTFLKFWMDIEERYFVKLIIGGDNPSFQSYCLDPSLAAQPLFGCCATVHMSGTLTPLDEYRDSLDMPHTTVVRTFPSPFPKENRRVLYVDDVTTKYDVMSKDPEMVGRLEDYTTKIPNIVGRNTAVFFPSYSMMERFISDGVLRRLKGRTHVERRGMTQGDLMDTVTSFRQGQGDVLLTVMGGRISEGLDFPDREMEMALIVGIPYPKPTARQRALLHYYDLKFGKGWDYTVRTPAIRKIQQAIGRLIRSESDRGVAVILDRRAEQFPQLSAECTQRLIAEVGEFFGSKGT